MKTRAAWLPRVVVCVGFALWPGPSWPQAEAAPPPEVEMPEGEAVDWPAVPPPDVEAIEITGERLDSTDVQDEAQAITTFDQADLDRAGILSVDNLGQNVPSLHVGQQGNQAIITLRGIGTQNASITGEPGVQFHVDGINYARPSAANVAFFDLEAVRVHRGPYGTSGGKNASGGAIEVVTRKPGDDWGVEGDYQIGSYDQKRARGAINIPLLPEYAKARFAFIRETRTGYQENLALPAPENRADDADKLGLRGHLSLTPSDDLELLLSYNYYRAQGVGPGLKLVLDPHLVQCQPNITAYPGFDTARPPTRRTPTYWVFDKGTTFAPPYEVPPEGRLVQPNGQIWVPLFYEREGITRLSDKTYCVDIKIPDKISRKPSEDPSDARKVYLDRVQEQNNRIWGYAASLKWDLPVLPVLGATSLSSISGFEQTFLSDPRDFDTTDVPILVIDPITNDSYQYSSELKLESAEGEWVDWLTGLFYQRERSDAFSVGTLYASDEGFRINQFNIVKSYGAYAKTTVHLNDSWSLGLGARYSRDFKRTRLLRENAAGFNSVGAQDEARKLCLTRVETNERAASLGVSPSELDPPVCKEDFGAWTTESVLEWRPTDSHLFYLQFDTGFKAGGFIIADSGRFEPEKNKAWTIGSKSQFFDGRLQLNLEAFNYDYTDFQVVNIDGTSIRTENAPETRVRGVDLEAQLEPIDGLRLDGKVGWLDARFREFCSVDPIDPTRAIPYSNGEIPCAGSGTRDNNGVLTFTYGTHPGDVLDGFDLPRSPRLTYTLGAEYSIPVGRWGTLIPRVQYFWTEEAYYRVYNTPVDYQDSHHKTDLRMMWVSPEETWSFEAFVENIENDDVFQNMVLGSSVVGPPPLAQYAPPRLYGFRVGFKY